MHGLAYNCVGKNTVPGTSNALNAYTEQQIQMTKMIKPKIKKQTEITKALKN